MTAARSSLGSAINKMEESPSTANRKRADELGVTLMPTDALPSRSAVVGTMGRPSHGMEHCLRLTPNP